MKILIIGKGGREHALAWKFAQSKKVTQIFVAEGNPACELLPNVRCVKLNSIKEFVDFAQTNLIDLTFVGSEELLVAGIVDEFQLHNLNIFGPNKIAAQLEGSKVFAKRFMEKYGVKTAKYQSFTCAKLASDYLTEINFPIVIKASGLAAGKGVIIAQDNNEATKAINDILINKIFGDSGNQLIIEEFLEGVEASILSFTDSNVIVPFISAKDHKKIGDGESGLNTGGMGVIAPNPYVTAEVNQQFINDILNPTLNGIKAEKMDFAGVIFFGVMITKNGVYLLEYNMRMGDPETQAVLPLLKNDLFDLVNATITKNLINTTIEWHQGATCCVVLASKGYPQDYSTGLPIYGVEDFEHTNAYLFAAGVSKKDNTFITSGGRVLNIVGIGEDLPTARNIAYQYIKQINFDGVYYRNDIGK